STMLLHIFCGKLKQGVSRALFLRVPTRNYRPRRKSGKFTNLDNKPTLYIGERESTWVKMLANRSYSIGHFSKDSQLGDQLYFHKTKEYTKDARFSLYQCGGGHSSILSSTTIIIAAATSTTATTIASLFCTF